MKIFSFNSHWNKQRWATIMEENSEKNTDFLSSNALQFYFGTIIRKKRYELTPDLIETYSKYIIVNKNDIVINGLNLNYDFVSQRVGMIKEQGIITSAYIAMRVRPDYNSAYYCYLLKEMDARKIFHGMGTGIRLTLSYKELKNILLPVPPRDEQDRIVHFLDWKVSEINRLINIKRRQIERLEELKKTVVSLVVTRGLNTDVKMKDSGANWIGDIPEHWKVLKLRQILHPYSKKNYPELPLLSVVREKGVIIRNTSSKEENHNYIPDDLSNYKKVKINQFVINKMKAWQGSYGISKYNGIVSPAYFVFNVIDNINLDFFNFAIRCKVYICYFGMASDGIRVGQWDLSINRMKEIPFFVPPIKEQQQIVAYLDEQMQKIEAAIANKQKQIETLQELKTRLISDVVTGKIDVRGVEIPDYEYVEEESDESLNSEEEPENYKENN